MLLWQIGYATFFALAFTVTIYNLDNWGCGYVLFCLALQGWCAYVTYPLVF